MVGEGDKSRRDGERRAYPRFSATLAGACSVSGQPDVPCSLIDMSMSGAALRVETNAEVGTAVIASLPQVGLLHGRVARVFPGGLAMAFDEGRRQRERIASYLTWLVARGLDDDLEERGAERIVPLRRLVEVSLGSRPATTARIVDVSRTGAALTTSIPASLGECVTVGGTQAVVARLFPGGFAVRFVEPLDADPDVTIVL